MTTNNPTNPNDRLWLRADHPNPPRPKSPKSTDQNLPFSTFDTVLNVLMVLNIIVGVLLVIAGLAGQGTGTAGVAVLGGAIACALGRVLVFSAQCLYTLTKQGHRRGL